MRIGILPLLHLAHDTFCASVKMILSESPTSREGRPSLRLSALSYSADRVCSGWENSRPHLATNRSQSGRRDMKMYLTFRMFQKVDFMMDKRWNANPRLMTTENVLLYHKSVFNLHLEHFMQSHQEQKRE
jgi:hypothetical protein